MPLTLNTLTDEFALLFFGDFHLHPIGGLPQNLRKF